MALHPPQGTIHLGKFTKEKPMLRSIAVMTLLVLSVPAMAQGISYNYIEGSFNQVELDDSIVDVDGDGFGIGGSFEVADQFHVFASFDTTDFDFDVDLDETKIGGGFHTSLSPNVDFVANLAWVRFDASGPGGSIDDDGFGASIGLRAMAGSNVELAGAIEYVDIGDGDDTSINGEAWYNFSETFAVGLNVGLGDDITRYGIGARLYFGQ